MNMISHKLKKYLKIPSMMSGKIYRSPYVLRFKNNSQEILLIGLKHNYIPNSPSIKNLDKQIIGVLKTYKNIVVIGEKNINRKEIKPSLKNIILKYGEAGLLAWRAKEFDKSYICPEPAMGDILNLTKGDGYNKKEIAIWAIANVLAFGSENKEKKIDGFLSDFIDRGKNRKKLASKSIYLKVGLEKIKKITGRYKLKNLRDWILASNKKRLHNHLKKISSPFEKGTTINKTAMAIELNRDFLIANKIVKIVKSGKSVVGAYGINHIIAQEPIFRKILEK